MGGCGGDHEEDKPLDVYAAASLAEVFPQIDPDARFSFAGSDELATQIREGAPADVYAAATSKYPQELFEAGLVEEPVTFASNRLVLIVPRGNPAAIESVEDILQRGTRLVVAAEGVPVGDYTRAFLETLGLSAALDNVVSNEDDVKGVAGKVALGEADAGFVYATDVTPVADRVLAIELPDDAQPPIEYQVAVVAESADKEQPSRSSKHCEATKVARHWQARVSSSLRRRRRVRHRDDQARIDPRTPGTLCKIRERHAAEQRDGRVANLLPYVAQRAADHHRTGLGVVARRAADRRERPLEETDDPLERDLFRILVESVAARRAALRAHDSGCPHRRHHLLEHRLRHGRPSRELLQLQRPPPSSDSARIARVA